MKIYPHRSFRNPHPLMNVVSGCYIEHPGFSATTKDGKFIHGTFVKATLKALGVCVSGAVAAAVFDERRGIKRYFCLLREQAYFENHHFVFHHRREYFYPPIPVWPWTEYDGSLISRDRLVLGQPDLNKIWPDDWRQNDDINPQSSWEDIGDSK